MDRFSQDDPEDFDPFVLRVRGLPWSASKEDIIKFFEGSNIKSSANGIHMTMSREGRPSGEAYVEFETEDDSTKGLEKNNEHLGSRYIEVFRSKKNEMEWALRRCGLDGEEAFSDACVRLRGLPFGCSKEEIAQFFTGLEIVRNGITLPTDFQGRSTGEAYVQFASQDIAEKAMGKHKEKIGHRYIEIFKSSLQEIRSSLGGGPVRMGRNMASTNRISPYDRMERPGSFGGGAVRGARRGGPAPAANFGDRGGFGGESRVRDTGHNVHMRGLPFRAIERDIFDFFSPLKPVAVRIKFESSGRSSGEADAMFGSHEEALRAMKKDKEKIQHRYIELFLQSEPDPFRGGGGGGGGGGNMGPFDIPSGNMFGDPPFGRGRPMDSDRGGFKSERGGFGNFGGGGRGGFGQGGGAMGDRGGFGGGAGRGFGQGGGAIGYGEGASGGYGGGSASGGYGDGTPERGGGFGGSSSPQGRGFGAGPAGGGGDRDFGFGQDKPYGQAPASAARQFGGGGGGGGGMADRSYGGGGDRGMGDGKGFGMGDKGYGMGGGGGGGGGGGYGGMGDRQFQSSGDGGFRNGMNNSGMGAGGNAGGYGMDNQRSSESEFYGSGKLFGENSYPSPGGQGMNMMNSSSYGF